MGKNKYLEHQIVAALKQAEPRVLDAWVFPDLEPIREETES